MAFDAHANLAISTVAVAPTPPTTGTTLTVAAGQGGRFSAPPFNASDWPPGFMPDPTNAEILRVTAVVGDVLTILRAQEGSTARAIVAGDLIAQSETVKTFTDIESATTTNAAAITTEATARAAADAAESTNRVAGDATNAAAAAAAAATAAAAYVKPGLGIPATDLTAAASTALGRVVVRGNGFVALGDSISCSSTAGTAGGGYGQAWPHMVGVLSQQRLNYLGNAGVSGENSTQILARVSNVLALKPQIVTVLAGTNDITQGVTFAVWSANIKSIAAQLRAANIRVVLCTLPPRDNTMTANTATTLIWNRWLRAYAQQNSFDLLDFFTLLVDGTTGLWATGLGFDSVHPNAAAHLAMANYVIAQILTPPYAPIQAFTELEADNLAPNPLFTTGAGPPTGWIVGGTGGITGLTESIQTDTDFVGRAWEWSFVTPSAGFRQLSSGLITTGWSVGDVLLFTAKAKVVTSTSLTPGNDVGISFKPFFNGGSTGLIDLVPGHSVVTPIGLYWFTYPVPTGTTSIQAGFIINNISAGATWKARVGQIGVFNLTALNLVTA